MQAAMNHKATYNPMTNDIELSDNHRQVMSFNQLQQLVRQANVESGIYPQKSFAFHLFECLYQFNRKEAINFLMVGVGEMFFDAPKELVLALTGKYFLGDFING
jgi:hypothetical protein